MSFPQFGEGADRRAEPGDYELSEQSIKVMKFLAEKFKSVIVVLMWRVIIPNSIEIEGINALFCEAGRRVGGDAPIGCSFRLNAAFRPYWR
jgi:hypothetical protein